MNTGPYLFNKAGRSTLSVLISTRTRPAMPSEPLQGRTTPPALQCMPLLAYANRSCQRLSAWSRIYHRCLDLLRSIGTITRSVTAARNGLILAGALGVPFSAAR
jgi:hypothetical protein